MKSHVGYLDTEDKISIVDKLEGILAGTTTIKKNSLFHFPVFDPRYVYLLKEGILKIIVNSEDGKQTILHLVTPGTIFGELKVLGDVGGVEEYAVALEDSVIWHFESDKFREFIVAQTELFQEINRQIAGRFKKTQGRLLAMIFKDAKTRILDYLVEFVKEFGEPTEESFEARNFLTNEDFARLTGTCRQTVNVVFNELRNNGVIKYSSEVITIPLSSPLLKKIKDNLVL